MNDSGDEARGAETHGELADVAPPHRVASREQPGRIVVMKSRQDSLEDAENERPCGRIDV